MKSLKGFRLGLIAIMTAVSTVHATDSAAVVAAFDFPPGTHAKVLGDAGRGPFRRARNPPWQIVAYCVILSG